MNLENKNKNLQLNILDLNEQISIMNKKTENYHRIKDQLQLENDSLREQLTNSMARVENISSRSLEIEHIQEKLSHILNEIKI